MDNLYIILSNTFETLTSLIKILVFSKWKISKKVIQERFCIILGNGPSLIDGLNIIPELLLESDLIATNFFAETELFEKLKPVFYVLIDPIFYKENISEGILIKRKLLFEQLTSRTNWNLDLLVPFEAKSNKEILNITKFNHKIKLKFFNKTPIEGFNAFRNYCFKKNLGMPRPHNVLIPSIILALNSGYKKIFLIGADHDWIPNIYVDKDNQVMMVQKHFYDSGKEEKKPMYTNGVTERKLHEILFSFYNVFKSYHIIKSYSDSINSKIYNLTETSFIDAFKKVKYKE